MPASRCGRSRRAPWCGVAGAAAAGYLLTMVCPPPVDRAGRWGQAAEAVRAGAPKPRSELAAASGPTAARYRQLAQASRAKVRVVRSPIHGYGVVAIGFFAEGDMVIEYVGELIRRELTDAREAAYNARGIGCYMFGIARSPLVIDATMAGSQARFVNHSCEPNCVSRLTSIDGVPHIIIYAKRDIRPGEELTYDYKFARDDSDRVPCSCGAPACTGWMD